ncbi:hypothetical protein QJQ45_019918 [Haematococcus lacustris]|nr:hypothetical protein QJQ45_019918 [Haematococcus lacustris]
MGLGGEGGVRSMLNPCAAAFAPARLPPQPQRSISDVGTQLTQLPHEVLSRIFCCLEQPRDVVHCSLACRLFLRQLSHAALRLDLSTPLASGSTVQQVPGRMDLMCASLPKYLPGTVQLDLANQSLGDAAAASLLLRLPRLTCLDLSGCKRLTQALTLHLSLTPPARLAGLALQRCFQLDGSALTHLLQAAAAGRLPLRCLALSHLDMEDWPTAAAAPAAANAPTPLPAPTSTSTPTSDAIPSTSRHWAGRLTLELTMPAQQHTTQAAEQLVASTGHQGQGQGPGEWGGGGSRTQSTSSSSLPPSPASPHAEPPPLPAPPCWAPASLPCAQLQVLALTNCTRLSLSSLAVLSQVCPRLQLLLLGGSTWCPPPPCPPPAAATLDPPSPALPPSSSSGLVQAHLLSTPHPNQLVTALLHLHPELQAQLQGPTAAAPAASSPPPALPASAPAALLLNLQLAAGLAVTAASLPELRVLELSFAAPALLQLLRQGLRFLRLQLQVWDLSSPSSAAAARALLHTRQAGAAAPLPPSSNTQQLGAQGGEEPLDPPLTLPPAALALGLRAAANCSAASRCSPLHVAAERGAAQHCRDLLELGAQPDRRDRGGCTALFLACEAGHAACVGVLLAGGAAMSLANSAGESPLYIAALRGHLRAVRELLQHCRHTGEPWQAAELYTDGWTPLMAAAVANRHGVAAALLAAAGPPGGEAAQLLVAAVNRHRQGVMHVAARKASLRLQQLLLEYGGAACCQACDNAGNTPLDIARKNRNTEAVKLLSAMRGVDKAMHQRQAVEAATATQHNQGQSCPVASMNPGCKSHGSAQAQARLPRVQAAAAT